jgi:flagellar basal-body rod modification protein FlgD
MIEATVPAGLAVPKPAATPAARASGDALGQKDFLTLLTAQLQNQDPLNPMQNTEFLGQMAQFSTVSGIERMNGSLEGLGAGLREMRMGMASNMIGQSVMVPASLAYPGRDGAYRGDVQLDQPAQDVLVRYQDATTGAVLHQEFLGPQRAGAVPFAWQNPPAEFVAGHKAVRISVEAQQGDTTNQLAPRVYAKVLAGVIGQGRDDISLDVEGFGLLQSIEVDAIR